MTSKTIVGWLVLITLWSAVFVSAAEPLVVLLKLDDVSGAHARYRQVVEFALAEGIKINFGVFGSSLEKENPEYFRWMNELKKTSHFEFWNHGYGGFGQPRETQGSGYEFQREKITRTQELSRQRLGEPFRAFGPHASAMDDDTFKVFTERPEIRLIFGPIPAGRLPGVFAATHRVPFEFGNLKPDLNRFKEQFERLSPGRDYIVIQGHPNAWREEADFESFKGMVRFLKDKGVRFMTISEFLDHQAKSGAAKTPPSP